MAIRESRTPQVRLVRPISLKQLADAETRARLRAFNKGLLAKPGTAQRPIAVHIVR